MIVILLLFFIPFFLIIPLGKAVYVPPNIRSGGVSANPSVGVSPRPYQPPVERGPIPGLPVGYKISQGQRKKDRNAKRKENDNAKQNIASNQNANTIKEEINSSQTNQNQATPATSNKRNQRRTPRQSNNQNHTNGNNSNDSTSTHNANANANVNVNNATIAAKNEEQPSANGSEAQKRDRRPRNRQRKSEGGGILGDPEKDKRMRTVQQKLRDIAKLKVRRDNGDNLEVNQLSKIGLEAELIKELNSLKVEA